MRIRSLRGRLLLATVLWTVGLLFLVSFVITMVIQHNPHTGLPRHVHAILQSRVTVAIAAGCLLLGMLQGRRGLASVDRVRTQLADLNAGRERRMNGAYPVEVQPLVDDLNALLDHRERAIERAIAKAGDLAHGLKTPLAVLAHEAECARHSGHTEIAEAIEQQITRMRRHVDYHLAHARAAASGSTSGARASVRESVDGLTRALTRVYAHRGLSLTSSIADPPSPEGSGATGEVRIQREDLDEMLGNLLDNACKWARSRVTIESTVQDHTVLIRIDDDGDGLPAGMRDAVLARGVRADEAAPGSGLGLAIVRDLAELYGAELRLDGSPLGGLRAELRCPRVTDRRS
jgi:signal transduction histidine kinase